MNLFQCRFASLTSLIQTDFAVAGKASAFAFSTANEFSDIEITIGEEDVQRDSDHSVMEFRLMSIQSIP